MKTPKTLPFTGAKTEGHVVHKNKPDYKKVKAISVLKSGESYITGNEFLKRLKEQKLELLNGDDLDYLIKNQDKKQIKAFLDPYRTKYLFAFGDIFSDSDGRLCGRCAVVSGVRWVSYHRWLDSGFSVRGLALSLADAKKLESDTLCECESLKLRVKELEKWASNIGYKL